MEIVQAEGLVKDYGSRRAVDGVSFHIHEGELFGFLGPNGAGKTTVMKSIYCFLEPTRGKLSVFGLDVRAHASEVKARLGVMPQEDNLDPDLTCLENLVVYARYFDIPPKLSRPRALALLEFVELTEYKDTNIQKLSGGQQRRLTLTRALMNDPELLILDEPTTGMDPHGRRAVWDYLADFKRQGKTMVLTTHYMEEATRLCDRVAVMDQGLIVALDRPSALMEKYGGDLEQVYLKLTGRRLEG